MTKYHEPRVFIVLPAGDIDEVLKMLEREEIKPVELDSPTNQLDGFLGRILEDIPATSNDIRFPAINLKFIHLN